MHQWRMSSDYLSLIVVREMKKFCMHHRPLTYFYYGLILN